MTRTRPAESGTERETLVALLDFLRSTVELKATGLSDEQAWARPIAASQLTVAGVVNHLTGVERFWFSIDFAGLDVPWPWTEDDPHGNFMPVAGTTAADVLEAYTAECERARQVVAVHGLDTVARAENMHFTLRYALAHMIEETARHCGHLDLLRESLDGVRGE